LAYAFWILIFGAGMDTKERFVIHVSKLTKYYGDYPAIRDVTFDVERGQIIGFLGPNGAGKTTTMRILAGFLNATSGQATIDGFDVFTESVEVRRRIGYLPENCPLYPEMRVSEYLLFRAGIKGLHGQRHERMDYVIDRCWLKDVRRQLIGTLSKGFRQRVGLADALLADPPVLILDEPTVGLDPAQIRETRKLIRELGQEHTILLSTHILPEVEMTCDGVIIIHKGQVAGHGLLSDLEQRAGEKSFITIETTEEIDTEPLKHVVDVLNFEREMIAGNSRVKITTENPWDLMPRLCALSVVHNWKVREIRPHRRTLEELFVRITRQPEDGAKIEDRG
jgi:ABC-2 type transport system ATP-binding protein